MSSELALRGLTAIKALREHGFAVDCFEQQDDVGGTWYYGSPHSPMYDSATMISSKRMTEFLDFRMPRDYPHYPNHRQVLAYMRDYARTFDLVREIHFNKRVDSVARGGSNEAADWHVQIADEPSPRDYDAVIVASGHHSQPRRPELGDEFTGQVIHSREYRHPDLFVGKNVLVIGAGNSGCDIAAELGRHAGRTWISLRRGYHFFPKFLCGAPLDRCGQTMSRFRLPWFVHRAISAVLLRVAVGPLKHYGLPAPDHRLFESHPIVNTQLLQELGHGRVHVKPAIARVAADRVEFVDGTCEPIDVIICATGFHLSWPFLATGVVDVEELDLLTFEPHHDGLCFVGLVQPNGGLWALADMQARLIAKYLLAQHQNPAAAAQLDRAIRRIPRRALSGGLHYVDSPRHALEVEYFAFRRIFERLLTSCDQLGLVSMRPPASRHVDSTVAPDDACSQQQPIGTLP